MSHKIAIITPVFNDWESFQVLVNELYEISQKDQFIIECIIAVNDGSVKTLEELQFLNKIPVTVLNLNNNLGHQRAISIGLSYLEEQNLNFDKVIVMDCDGEDRPIDIKKLITKVNHDSSDTIVFAKREKRSEGFMFKLFYHIYKKTFFALTSQKLDFGNFSCIPNSLLAKVVSIPDIWNHYSGGIIKSKIPYVSVGTDRGNRYQGSSKMNFQNLVLHGLSSISIYLDIVSVRLLITSMGCTLLFGVGLIIIVFLAFFNVLSITGWSSVVGLILINIFSIVVLITFLILLFQLNQKSIVKFSPKTFYKDFVLSKVSYAPKS